MKKTRKRKPPHISPQVTQLRNAWGKSGLTLDALVKAAGLKLSRVSMSRKLAGIQPITTKECAALSRALGASVSFGVEAA